MIFCNCNRHASDSVLGNVREFVFHCLSFDVICYAQHGVLLFFLSVPEWFFDCQVSGGAGRPSVSSYACKTSFSMVARRALGFVISKNITMVLDSG